MNASTKLVPTKIVAIYPYTRGFGYAVMENALELKEFNLFDMKKFNSLRVLELVKEIFSIHGPATLILENTNCDYCRKGEKTKQTIRTIAAWAKGKGIYVQFYSRNQIRAIFKRWNATSKYEIAEVLSRNIQQLKPLLFEKPKYPAREPNIEAVFSAVSMGVTHYFKTN